MSDDKKTDKKLSRLLGGMETPPADEAYKKRDIALAVDAFKAAQAEKTEKSRTFLQGIRRWFRPTRNNQNRGRSKLMSFRTRMIISGVSAACAGLVTVAVFLHAFDIRGIYDQPELADADLEQPERPVRRDMRDEKKDAAEVAVRRKARAADSARLAKPEAPAPGQIMEEVTVAGIRASGPAPARERMPAPPDTPSNQYYKDVGRDRFEDFETNLFKVVAEEPVSTFSADVDTSSYSFVRRQLNQGVLPQKDAVRVEEMINYFDYDYPLARDKSEPFKPFVAVTGSPWAEGRKLLHIGIKGYDIPPDRKPRTNLVFLLDVSGSMNSPDKLPLVKQSMELLLTALGPEDTVAIAVYAGAAGAVLEPTRVKDRQRILAALSQLQAGGSTAGAEGIRLAYRLAEANFDKDAVNRVILATDGDFNVGITNREELKDFVERKRDKGIFLSVLGFGQGNYHDRMMQTLAQNGNGVAAYIDTLGEAQKVLVEEAGAMLFPIAKDVKIQVEFNPATVAEYRLIGYETRRLNREDFNNDAVDAGDIGAGHTVTALYEIVPAGSDARMIDESRYGQAEEKADQDQRNSEYAFLKIRYKLPDEDKSRLITQPVGKAHDLSAAGNTFEPWVERDTGFAAAVAGFAQLLKGGKYTGAYGYDDVIESAQRHKGADEYGYRTEFIQLVRKAKTASAMRAD